MSKQIAVLVFVAGLACVAASQLIVKARFTTLGTGWTQDIPWVTMLGRVLTDPIIILGGMLVVIGAVCWYVALTKLPLSLMLPAAGIVGPVVSIGAYFLLGEALTLSKLAAISTIAVGVAWLGWLNA